MSTFVIVPGAWDTPATLEPLREPLESAGHGVIIVDLPTMASSVGADIVEIATGHGPFREQPDRLAELLVAGAR